ncbi:MAG: Gfo/Idh/MocA family protein [bacterium]
MNTIRWGIIGCGNVTELKSGPAYQKTEGFEVTAVMRRNKEKLLDYATRHQIPHAFTNAIELIESQHVDAVYIATPPDSHMKYALEVAKAGKPCCIEKPMAPNHVACEMIIKAFKEKNIPLFVAYYRRSLPRFNQVKEWLDNNEIGAVRSIHWNLLKPPKEIDIEQKYQWRTDPEIAPGGYFDDLACHGLDLFSHFFGKVKTANGISTNQLKLYGAKDAIVGNWIYQNGITGSGHWNFGSDRHEDHVRINGSKGIIEFSVFHDKPLKLANDAKEVTQSIDNPKHIQIYHVENIRNSLLDTNLEHPSTGDSASHTSWIMDQILK